MRLSPSAGLVETGAFGTQVPMLPVTPDWHEKTTRTIGACNRFHQT
jgi:hypothetical protein